jgi:hypothetical protein
MAQRTLVEIGRQPPPGVQHDEAHRTANRRICAITGSKRIGATVHSSFAGKWTVDDDQRRGDVRGRLDTVQVKSPISQRQHRSANNRCIFRTAAGHYHVDRKHFAGKRPPSRSHLALDELRIAAQNLDNGVELFLRRWNDRKPVGPAAIVVEFNEIRAVRHGLNANGRAELLKRLRCHLLSPAA